jgi:hypothetical protein
MHIQVVLGPGVWGTKMLGTPASVDPVNEKGKDAILEDTIKTVCILSRSPSAEYQTLLEPFPHAFLPISERTLTSVSTKGD